jgi:hypothetical protein
MNQLATNPLSEFYARHGALEPLATRRIRAGRNSEVLHLSNSDGQWVVKHYYKHPNDPRDRLGVEFEFLMFLAGADVRCVPRPLGKDIALSAALYSFIPGERPVVIGPELVSQAASFIASINLFRESPAASALRPAADSCFSLREHMALAASRVGRLVGVRPQSDAEAATRAFVAEQLMPLCERLQQRLGQEVEERQLAETFPQASRIISPSDFGFHNTLLHDGRLSFVDFEYAGWDDPAKLVCDFICQPELPVSEAQGRQFCEEVSSQFPHADADAIRRRVRMLLPVHRLKWCCILLNELRIEDRKRRLHAAGMESDGLLAVQLGKAQRYFSEHLAPLT